MLLLRHNRDSQVDNTVPYPGIMDGGLSLNWYVFSFVDDYSLNLSVAPEIIETFRKSLIKAADGNYLAMRLVSGHESDGTATVQQHLSIIPLANVGAAGDKGELLGLAVILPQVIGNEERRVIYETIQKASHYDGMVKLFWADKPAVFLKQQEWSKVYGRLNPEYYCQPSCCWGTMTPMVPDKMKKRREDIEKWYISQVNAACLNLGLPVPSKIECGAVPYICGAPHASVVRPLLRRSDNQPRWHFHIKITFDEEVAGPLILGSGRFRGYGVCLPIVPSVPCPLN